MPGEYPNVGFRRLEALTRCLAPCELSNVGSRFNEDLSARHDLIRALCGGFREVARTELGRQDDDTDQILDRLPQSWWFGADELRIVVTGFGPFLDHERNPSWDVAQSFARVFADSFSVSCERVAVTYEDAASLCARQGVEQGQRLVVHFGLRASGSQVALERYAHNCRGQVSDESGRCDWPDVVVPGGPTALETLLPVRRLASALDARLSSDVEPTGARVSGAKVSRDVGEYVCNAIYYHSLQAASAARQAGRAAEALFVHVPPLDSASAAAVGEHFGECFKAHLGELFGGV